MLKLTYILKNNLGHSTLRLDGFTFVLFKLQLNFVALLPHSLRMPQDISPFSGLAYVDFDISHGLDKVWMENLGTWIS